MYGYIYKTTNLINNKIYIGQHKSEIFDIKYFGSGKLILEAITKYGIENFKCEIIVECNSAEELNAMEIYYIDLFKSKVNNGNYNISDGGFVPRLSGELNGNFGIHRPHTKEEKEHLSQVTKGHKPTFTKKHSNETKEKISTHSKNQKHTVERDEKVSEHHKGAKFLTNGFEQHWFYGDEVTKMKSLGWYEGICKRRKPKKKTDKIFKAGQLNSERLKDTIWVHKGNKKIQIKLSELNNYLLNGFTKGMKDK